jgi:mannose-6-phosphate isomerase-like protein (cupin superfamily)
MLNIFFFGKFNTKGEIRMEIRIVDLLQKAQNPQKRRTLLMNGPRFHTWLTVYEQPGEHDEMHCHNADQIFYCVGGECTMYFKDGSYQVLKPGMIALIPGGSFYWLKNTGTGKMILLGARGLSDEASQKIDFVTRKNINEGQKGDPPKHTVILV